MNILPTTSPCYLLILGKWRGKIPVAIKQLRDDKLNRDDERGFQSAKAEFLKEAKIFKMVNHPNLVQVQSSYLV